MQRPFSTAGAWKYLQCRLPRTSCLFLELVTVPDDSRVFVDVTVVEGLKVGGQSVQPEKSLREGAERSESVLVGGFCCSDKTP